MNYRELPSPPTDGRQLVCDEKSAGAGASGSCACLYTRVPAPNHYSVIFAQQRGHTAGQCPVSASGNAVVKHMRDSPHPVIQFYKTFIALFYGLPIRADGGLMPLRPLAEPVWHSCIVGQCWLGR